MVSLRQRGVVGSLAARGVAKIDEADRQERFPFKGLADVPSFSLCIVFPHSYAQCSTRNTFDRIRPAPRGRSRFGIDLLSEREEIIHRGLAAHQHRPDCGQLLGSLDPSKHRSSRELGRSMMRPYDGYRHLALSLVQAQCWNFEAASSEISCGQCAR